MAYPLLPPPIPAGNGSNGSNVSVDVGDADVGFVLRLLRVFSAADNWISLSMTTAWRTATTPGALPVAAAAPPPLPPPAPPPSPPPPRRRRAAAAPPAGAPLVSLNGSSCCVSPQRLESCGVAMPPGVPSSRPGNWLGASPDNCLSGGRDVAAGDFSWCEWFNTSVSARGRPAAVPVADAGVCQRRREPPVPRRTTPGSGSLRQAARTTRRRSRSPSRSSARSAWVRCPTRAGSPGSTTRTPPTARRWVSTCRGATLTPATLSK